MQYSHQLYENTTIRSHDRLHRLTDIPESEIESFEISINEQVNKINSVIQSKDNKMIYKELNDLYELINRGITISSGIFKNEQFVHNLSSLIFNPDFYIMTCKLLSRILNFTDNFGICLHDLLVPLYHSFLENIQSPEVEYIVGALCNLSADLLHFECPDDYLDKTICHPLKKIARDITNLAKIVKDSNYVITFPYLLFVRYVANFSLPTESLKDTIQYFKFLLINKEVQENNEFKRVVFWTLYDIMNNFHEFSYKHIIKDDFVPFLVSQMKADNFMHAQPIIGIFYYIEFREGYIEEEEEEEEDNPENSGNRNNDKKYLPIPEEPRFDFDLDCIFNLCLNAPDESIKFESFQFVHVLTEKHPTFMYSKNVIQLLQQATECNCSYKIKYQILWIACLFVSRRNISFLEPESIKILLNFIINNSVDDEEREYLAIQYLILFRRTMLLERKFSLYEQLMAESGTNDYIEQLRDSNNENICLSLELFDGLENESIEINNTIDGISNVSPLFLSYYDNSPLTREEAEMVNELNMVAKDSDDDDDDDGINDNDISINNNDNHTYPRITFVYNTV